MGYGAAAGRSDIDLARVSLGVRDEFRNRLGGNGWIDRHEIRAAADARDRRNVADELEIELLVQRRVHCVREAGKQERIAVPDCPHDRFGADIAAGARSILDHEWLPEPLR